MKFFEGVGITVSAMGIVALLALMNGLVLSAMWRWFMVPLGLPSVSIALAIGISLVVSYLTYRKTNREPKDDMTVGEKFVSDLATGTATTGAYFLIGWLVHFFV